MAINTNTYEKSVLTLMELTGKEAHLIKILRNMAFGEFTVTKQNNNYTIAKVLQSIKLEEDPRKHIIVRDQRNIGYEEVVSPTALTQ